MGHPDELLALKERAKKALCTQIANKVDEPDGIPNELVAAVKKAFTPYTKENLAPMLDAVKVGRQNLITGQQFITDEEALLFTRSSPAAPAY